MSGFSATMLAAARPVLRITKRFISANVSVGNYKTATVKGAQMCYLDAGQQQQDAEKTVVFLHGNPTSSYLWRNIIPHLTDVARCVAPDLIGMGKSQKVPNLQYTFEDHFAHLSELFNNINLPNKVNLVIHDWGSALGFHWANQNRHRVESITFMEALVAPIKQHEFPAVAAEAFKGLRSPLGEEMILENNFFVEQILQMGIARKLSADEMEEYRKPFLLKGESRRPTLTFPRELIIEGVGTEGPDYVREAMNSYNKWLSESSSIPKMFIDAEPGMLSVQIRKVVKNWPNLKTVRVKGLHYVQEDSPDDIGKAIREFLTSNAH